MGQPPTAARAPRPNPLQHVTVVYSDLTDSVGMIRTLHASQHRVVKAHLKKCARAVARKYGGVLAEAVGDSVLLMFGYGQPSEQDGRRAVEATLELHSTVRQVPANWRFRVTLSLHSGVHSGFGDVEGGARYGYRVAGVVPSTAQRLAAAAGDNDVFVSATTLGADISFFETQDRGTLTLKGLPPTAVVNVCGVSGTQSRFEARAGRGLAPFIGRGRELQVMTEHLGVALAGRVAEIVLCGPAGVGKTRLVEEFLHALVPPTALICRGYCEHYLAAEPLQPFRQIQRRLSSVHGVNATAVPPPQPLPHGPDDRRADSAGADGRLPPDSQAFVDLFALVAAHSPVVLFIDDWQWADDATRQTLAAIRRLDGASLLVITAVRETPLEAAVTHVRATITLAPFDETECIAAIKQLRPDTHLLAQQKIQVLSGGNPLFIEELCHRDAHDRVGHSAGPQDQIPAWLATLIQARVAHLPPDASHVVRAAAVVGGVIPLWLLERLTGVGGDDPIVRELAECDLLFPGIAAGTLRFKHGVTRDVIYASVGLREREWLHRRCADLIEREGAPAGDEMVEALAYHFNGASDPERTALYAESAGRRAFKAGALDRARNHYSAALTALDRLEPTPERYRRWLELLDKMGLACVYDPDREHLPLFTSAVQRTGARGDTAGLAIAEYWLGFNHYALGELPAALTHYRSARAHCAIAQDAARHGEPPERLMALQAKDMQIVATIGQVHAAAGENADALQAFEQALTVKRLHRKSGQPAVGSAYTLACKGAVLGDMGEFSQAYECFDEALVAITGAGSPVEGSVLVWQSAVQVWQGRWADAIESAQRAQRIAEQVASLYVLAMSHAATAYAHWRAASDATDIDLLLRATSWLDAHEKHLFISINYAWLAEMLAASGRERDARVFVARTLRRARKRDGLGAAAAYRVLASLPDDGKGKAPDDYLAASRRAAVARGSRREQALTLLAAARLAAASGRTDEALAQCARARAEFVAMGMTSYDDAAARLLVS